MVLEKLGSSLKATLAKIAGSMFVDEKLINELVKDIQRALLQSDVNVRLVFELTKRIKERAMKENHQKALSKKEHLISIVYEELVNFLGKEGHKINVGKKPFNIMLVGLFGSGKTTTAGKLGKFFSKRGFKVALVGLDVHRPSAMDQLEQVAKGVSLPSFIDRKEKDPVKIWKNFEPEVRKHDVVIVDTAGRDALSKDLVEELETINRLITPSERLLVISADIGQAAQTQAQQFHKSCEITGVIATKMDGTAKAGGALSACAATAAPIKFIGVGEKADDLEEFRPEGFVSRMLGMGDIEALLEKAKDAVSDEQAKDITDRMASGKFNLIDLYEQMNAMKKMGPLSKVMEMIPGFGQLQLPKEALHVQEGKLQTWKHIMDSMTKDELENPDIVSPSRIDRISGGSGCKISDVRELLKQYRQSKKVIKMLNPSKAMKQGDMKKLMQRFGKGQIKMKGR